MDRITAILGLAIAETVISFNVISLPAGRSVW